MANGPVLVVDFGAQYAQLIARRVREANVYSELVPHSMPVDEMLAKDPQAIILSGGPASVFEPGAPRVDPKLFDAGVPVLGICYGFQAMAYALGADVDKAALGEYGKTDTTIDKTDGLLAGSPAEQDTWMSHGVAVKTAPAGFEVLAHTEGAPVAAMQDESRKLYGVQWHPEVKHTPLGQKLIETFLHQCAGLPDNWDASSIIEDQVAKIREKVGDAEVICGLSGGVDSAVAAALVHKAIGDQLTCVFVDHGLLRKGEVEQVKHDFVAATGIRLITVDAAADFLEALKGVSEPERKRKIIGEKFIRTFEKAQRQVLEEAGARGKEVKFLVQGTLYPDVVESGGGDGAANIKSHHNVGGLPKDIKFQLIEPLRTLFKDEVRAIGTELGLPDEIVWRQPFPGPGLGIRIIGEITKERLDLLREADAIVAASQAQVDSLRRAAEIARLQYDNGYTDYLTVLDAERQLFSAELSLANALRDRLNAVVSVCMALGGGWQDPNVKPSFPVADAEELVKAHDAAGQKASQPAAAPAKEQPAAKQ